MKFNESIFKVFVLLSIIAIFLHCSDNVAYYYTSIENGIEIVHNNKPRYDENINFSIELEWQLGDINTEDENYLFFAPKDITLDNENNIYVLDSGNGRIQKYSDKREYLNSFGSQGQGPGEFIDPVKIAVDDKGNIFVGDDSKKTIMKFNKNGDPVDQIKLENFNFMNFELLESEIFLLKANDKKSNMITVDFKGTIIDEIGTYNKHENSRFEIYANYRNILYKNNAIYAVYQHLNKIEKYSKSGNLNFTIKRELEFPESDNAETALIKISGAELMLPDINYISKSAAIDNRDNIWILSYRRQELPEEMVFINFPKTFEEGFLTEVKRFGNSEIKDYDIYKLEIFSPDGILLQEIPLKHYADRIKIYDDMLYIIDTSITMSIYAYRIEVQK